MNVSSIIASMRRAKSTIKRLTPEGSTNYIIKGDVLKALKASDFGRTLQKMNLVSELDHMKVTTVKGEVGIYLNDHRFSVKTFTSHLDKGDLIGAYRSIGIPPKALTNAVVVKRAENFKVGFEAGKLQRMRRKFDTRKQVAISLRGRFNLPTFTSLDKMKRTFKSNKAFRDRILIPLYQKIIASPQRIPILKGLVAGGFTSFVGALVVQVITYMRERNGCWMHPRSTTAYNQSECKVEALTCDAETAKASASVCTDVMCTNSKGHQFPCFNEGASKVHCNRFKTITPLCGRGDEEACSWACNTKRICVPDDKQLQCVNYTFWEAFVALTHNFLPEFGPWNYALAGLAVVCCLVLVSWLFA